jgi:hypothetical protein
VLVQICWQPANRRWHSSTSVEQDGATPTRGFETHRDMRHLGPFRIPVHKSTSSCQLRCGTCVRKYVRRQNIRRYLGVKHRSFDETVACSLPMQSCKSSSNAVPVTHDRLHLYALPKDCCLFRGSDRQTEDFKVAVSHGWDAQPSTSASQVAPQKQNIIHISKRMQINPPS